MHFSSSISFHHQKNLLQCTFREKEAYLGKKQTNKQTLIWKDTCTPEFIFIVALFTVAKKQPKCPSTDEWIKMWCIYTYNGILLSHKKGRNFAICSNMDTEGIMLSEISQTEKANTVWHHLYVESKKKYNKLVNLTKKQIHRFSEQTSGYQWEEGRGEGQYRGRELRDTNYQV